MLHETGLKDGVKCIANIRHRYDGLKRSPFDEAECGHHYVRAMISWAEVLALTGFHYMKMDENKARIKIRDQGDSPGLSPNAVALKRD